MFKDQISSPPPSQALIRSDKILNLPLYDVGGGDYDDNVISPTWLISKHYNNWKKANLENRSL